MIDALTARYPALAHSRYRRYLLASFAAVGGTQLVTLGQGWLVFQLSGSALDLGLLGAAASVPNIVVALFGGVVADRFDKRRILLVTSAATAALLFALALLDATGVVAVWHVWLVAGLVALITGVEWPTRQAFFPHLIDRDGLMSAVALNSFTWQSTRMIIPAAGGLLIAVFDTAVVFALAGFGFLAMFHVLWRLTVEVPRHAPSGSPLQQVREGMHYIWTEELFRWLIGLSFASMFFAYAYMQIMPAFVPLLGAGETGYGFLLSATGLGSVAGTLAIASFQQSARLGTVVLGGAGVSGLCLYAFALAIALGWYPLALVAVFCVSFFSSVFMISAMTALQVAVPDALRGRVMGIHTITYSLMPLGGLLLGAIADRSSAVVAVCAGASVFVVFVVVIAGTRPAIRTLEGVRRGSDPVGGLTRA
jgi:MFS family permease